MTNVTYQKICTSCGSTRGTKHIIFWNGTDELYDTSGLLISEKEMIPIIDNWLTETEFECFNESCQSIGNWEIWDIAVGQKPLQYYPITPTERREIEKLRDSGTNVFSMLGYRMHCKCCMQPTESKELFYPDSEIYFNEMDLLFEKQVINNLMQQIRLAKIECTNCRLKANWEIFDMEMHFQPLNE